MVRSFERYLSIGKFEKFNQVKKKGKEKYVNSCFFPWPLCFGNRRVWNLDSELATGSRWALCISFQKRPLGNANGQLLGGVGHGNKNLGVAR